MNTDPDAAAYAKRCIRDLGLQANDTERALIWAYDHPPRKPLPKCTEPRERNIYISRTVFKCLMAAGQVDALANSILLLWINENMPDLWATYIRHEEELEARIAELRHNEPDLQPHCSSDIGEAE